MATTPDDKPPPSAGEASPQHEALRTMHEASQTQHEASQTQHEASQTQQEAPKTQPAPSSDGGTMKPSSSSTKIRSALDHMLAGGVDPAEYVMNGDAAAECTLKRKPSDVVSAAELMSAWDNYKEVYGTNGMVAQGMHKRHCSSDEREETPPDAEELGGAASTEWPILSPAEQRAENIRAAFSV
eukprot:CAMPEP_0113247500 /NCGR_PEP_ID=MMETSP0008_2-20120614/10025_1 /TAXON_ID=97485 /ORGANISM="Prymnesium parvum" /LENGTH=183 /DNA_ID=CAMNT_0000095303 /DNA_START=23 /DNA_END=574 /DNA_ORIENTATION=+ /assembly_acc=CAM_ASM_000153